MRKALSPLMASVILIAITLAVGGLLGSWFTTMTKTETSTIEKGAIAQIGCASAILEITRVACSNSSQELRVTIHNTGDVELYNFSTYAYVNNTGYINKTGGPNSTDPLNPGEQYILSYFCDKTTYCSGDASVTQVRVSPGNCPNAWTEEKDSYSCAD